MAMIDNYDQLLIYCQILCLNCRRSGYDQMAEASVDWQMHQLVVVAAVAVIGY
jgi:hypothetical protein